MTDIEPTTTEVGRLKTAINAMLDRVDAAISQRDATVRQMRRFIGDASHELRTPLVTVRGYAELYRMGAIRGDEDVAQSMDRIEKEAIRMGCARRGPPRARASRRAARRGDHRRRPAADAPAMPRSTFGRRLRSASVTVIDTTSRVGSASTTPRFPLPMPGGEAPHPAPSTIGHRARRWSDAVAAVGAGRVRVPAE